jgi:hypothetical protein
LKLTNNLPWHVIDRGLSWYTWYIPFQCCTQQESYSKGIEDTSGRSETLCTVSDQNKKFIINSVFLEARVMFLLLWNEDIQFITEEIIKGKGSIKSVGGFINKHSTAGVGTRR